jgi:hypothetical protein
MHRFLAVSLTLLCAAAAQAKVELRGVQSSYGQLGPARESAEYVLGDEVYVRFTVAGARTDAEGRLRGEITFAVTDGAGKKVLDGGYPLQQAPVLGGDTFPAYVSVRTGDPMAPGKYTLEVQFRDLLAKESAAFKHEFTCKPVEFAAVAVRFSQDAAGRVPAPVGGFVSQTLFLKMKAVGFDRSQGEIDVEMAIEVLDAQGKPVSPRPVRAAVHSEKPDEVRAATFVSFSGEINLNRAGEFRLRVTVTDRQAKKTATFEAPMKVLAP